MSRIFKHDGGNRPARKKSLTMLVSLALILLVSVGGTLAYLVTQTDAVENTFTPAKNDITVEEEFDNQTKKNVGVTNNSDFAVFVRMQIVETWMEGGAIVATPDGVSVNYSKAKLGWVKHTDGFWYYTQPVAKDQTVTLFDSITATRPEKVTAELNLEVLAQSVQAEPKTAVTELWGIDPTTLK